ncbi:hypothetical protein [Thalassobaculum sp.]|uniref:hypothetical protein n=1 Tax=Thalassobaculum sp. TaxID=2022740 RepID=UPI0032EDEF6A
MSEAANSLWPGEHGDDAATLIAALRIAGIGVAVLNRSGHVVTADERFWAMQGVGAGSTGSSKIETGRTLGDILSSSASGSPDSNGRILSDAWLDLIDAMPSDGEGHKAVSLDDGRMLELAAMSAADGSIVLTVAVPGARQAAEAERQVRSRVAHDMNNLVGGMLANLHLCLADLPNDHPVRKRLEVVNQSALELRSKVQKVASS